MWLNLDVLSITLLLLDWCAASPINNAKRQNLPTFEEEYDFIIAGGGTAGLTLANRLTESGKFTVLCVESGLEPTVVEAYSTPGGNQFLKGSLIEWGLTTVPQTYLSGRILQYLRGRALGGSSAINGLYYARGSASIYDYWERLGNKGWGWKDIYQLFIKSTHFNPPDGLLSKFDQTLKTWEPSAYSNGPLEIGFQGYVAPATRDFMHACSEAANLPIVQDLNTGRSVGIKQGTATLDSRLRRSSSYDGFYKQASSRSNLKVVHDASVTGIAMDTSNGTAHANGISYVEQRTGLVRQARALKEVIVSMGAFHTPQLLMLSGIGPSAELAKFAIEPVVINENVGNHLNDHSVFSIMARAKPESSTTNMSATADSLQAAQADFYNNLDGQYTAPSGITNGFQELPDAELQSIGAQDIINAGLVNQSHIEYLFESVWYPWIPTPYYRPLSNESYIAITASSMVALSRGNVSLKSSSMTDPPNINPNYYSHDTDRKIAIHAFKYLRKILAHPLMARHTIGPNNGEVSPGPAVSVDDENAIFEYIKANTFPNWHASGTAQMLPKDQGGVVDDRLRVYGVNSLRVIDCSIIPHLPDANILASIYMIAEKGAELIREDWSDIL